MSTPNSPELGPELVESLRRRRGHNFYPPKDVRAQVPPIGANDNLMADEHVVHLHYFIGGMDWYVTEVDWSTGEAFGYAALGLGGDEWGYSSLPELEAIAAGPLQQPIERDLDWTPTLWSEVQR